MCERGAIELCQLQVMVVGYCKMGDVLEADRWLGAMIERGVLWLITRR